MKVASYSYDIYCTYFQFYIQDEKASDDIGPRWTSTAVRDMLVAGDGIVGIGTARDGKLAVVLEIHDSEPKEAPEQWDHVAECSFDVMSGTVVVGGWTGEFAKLPRINVKSGTYRIRVYSGGFRSISADGEEGNDHYKVCLWPGGRSNLRVTKRSVTRR